MAESGLSIQDIVGRKASTSNATSGANKIAPKYRNSATGETWTGRGKRPKWVVARLEAGENLESMLIQQPGTQGA
jgi:DNA-binding protein H-NS